MRRTQSLSEHEGNQVSQMQGFRGRSASHVQVEPISPLIFLNLFCLLLVFFNDYLCELIKFVVSNFFELLNIRLFDNCCTFSMDSQYFFYSFVIVMK